MQPKSDGIWARVEWTPAAREMITNKEFRYISPSIRYVPQTRQIVRIDGAGLVHNPNLYLKALASEETQMQPNSPDTQNAPKTDFVAKFAALLNLPANTPIEDLVAKIKSALENPDPAKFVPIAAVQDMMKQRNSQAAQMSEERIKDKVETAIKEGYIVPAMRNWALALCHSDETAFDDFKASTMTEKWAKLCLFDAPRALGRAHAQIAWF